MALYRIIDNLPVKWRGEPINGIQHPSNIERLWKPNALNDIGLYPLIDIVNIPDGKEIEGESVEFVDGQVKKVYTFRDVDIETKRSSMEISRLQLKAILLNNGLLEKVEAMISQGDTITQLAWAEAATIRRNSPIVLSLAAHLTWNDSDQTVITAEEVDALFETAKQMEF